MAGPVFYLQYPHLQHFHDNNNEDYQQAQPPPQQHQLVRAHSLPAMASFLVASNSENFVKLPVDQNYTEQNIDNNTNTVRRRQNAVKKETKRYRRAVFTNDQRLILEQEFSVNMYITTKRKVELAQWLGLTDRQVKVWFQNRRAVEGKSKREKAAAEAAAKNNNQPATTTSSDEQEAALAMTMLPQQQMVLPMPDGNDDDQQPTTFPHIVAILPPLPSLAMILSQQPSSSQPLCLQQDYNLNNNNSSVSPIEEEKIDIDNQNEQS